MLIAGTQHTRRRQQFHNSPFPTFVCTVYSSVQKRTKAQKRGLHMSKSQKLLHSLVLAKVSVLLFSEGKSKILFFKDVKFELVGH